MTAPARVKARRVLVRHLSEQVVRPLPFGDLLAAILDGLTDAGILPGAGVPAPRQPDDSAAATQGRAVVAARRARGWTVRDLAAHAAVGRSTVTRIEHDVDVRPDLVAAVLTALDLTPET